MATTAYLRFCVRKGCRRLNRWRARNRRSAFGQCFWIFHHQIGVARLWLHHNLKNWDPSLFQAGILGAYYITIKTYRAHSHHGVQSILEGYSIIAVFLVQAAFVASRNIGKYILFTNAVQGGVFGCGVAAVLLLLDPVVSGIQEKITIQLGYIGFMINLYAGLLLVPFEVDLHGTSNIRQASATELKSRLQRSRLSS